MRFPIMLTVSAILAFSSAHAHDGHVHQTYDVAPEGAPAISNFTITADPSGGFVVSVAVENFTFVEHPADAPAEGHAGHVHLSINGSDLGMFYSPTFTLQELPFGPHDLKVVLSSPEHADYAIDGRVIHATTTITVE
jgi:hypothetical protein